MFYKMGRRHFLKTSSGIAVSIPFLPSMANAAEADQPLLRFVTCRSQQGTYKDLFRPDVAALTSTNLGDETRSYDLTKILGALSATFGPEFNALKAKINFYSGLSPMVTEGGHNFSTFLCAYNQASPNGSDIFLNDAPPDKQYIMPNTQSIDRIIAEKAFTSPSQVMNISMTDYEPAIESQSYSYILSGGRIVRPRAPYDPALHFKKYFLGANTVPVAADAKATRRSLVVDMLLDSYKSFTTQHSLPSEEQVILKDHMEFLFRAESKIKASNFKTCSDPGISIDEKFYGVNTPLSYGELIIPTYKLIIDIAVAAMRCDAIRVFNLCMHASASALSGGGGPHGIHHMDPAEPGKKEYARALEAFYGQMLAYLVSQMNSVQEATGSLLDNSLVLHGKEMSTEGLDHNTNDMLVATIGSLGGKIKTGQLLDYMRTLTQPNQPKGDLLQSRSYNQFLTSIMQGGFGLKPEDFEYNNDFGERHETIWANTPFVEKRVPLRGMFV